MGYRVAVVGATGAVGREMLKTLAERNFPVCEVVALASGRSTGPEVSFGEKKVLTVQQPGHVRLHRLGHRPVQPRRRGLRRPCPARRRGRLHRDRQHQPVPHGARRAAGGAGGEPAGAAQLRQAQHHRQPELLDHPDGGRAEAAARPVPDQARGRLDLPVRLRRRQGRHGRAVQPDASDASCTTPSRRSNSPSRSPSTASRTSTSSWTTARPRKSGRWWSRPEDPRPRHRRASPPACACRCSSATARR